jgi:GNAT superfamily N-acetyltransferase
MLLFARPPYPPGMQVRPATIDDFDAVTALLEDLGRPAVDDQARKGARAVFQTQVADPDADHLVAVEDTGSVIGFCSLHYRPRLNHLTMQAWIPDLIVSEDSRGTGAGRALLEEAERRARARGCHDITLESAYHRERAHAVYLAAGMHDAGKSFWKGLR